MTRRVCLFLIGLAAACKEPAAPGATLPDAAGLSCAESRVCATPFVCANGICRSPCNINTDCGSSIETCENGACVPGNGNNNNGTECGNGELEVGEACDDDNIAPSDGCSPTCVIESGWQCSGTPSVCTLSCGNGVIDGAEQCDDGANLPLDGCSATCITEDFYVCIGQPSFCECNGDTQDHDGDGLCTYSCDGDPARGCSVYACDDSSGAVVCGTVCAVYVDPSSGVANPNGRSWATAFSSLRTGLDRADDEADECVSIETRVAAGTYYAYEGTRADSFIIPEDVGLVGSYLPGQSSRDADAWRIHPTILSGADGDPVTERVKHTVIMRDGSSLDGVVVSWGHAEQQSGDLPSAGEGGGINVENASVTVRNTIIRDNRAERGGGISLRTATAELDNVMVTNNLADFNAGGIFGEGVTLVVRDSVISMNRASFIDSGGLYLGSSHLTMSDCEVVGNSSGTHSGGLNVTTNNSPSTLVRTIIAANSSEEGGAGSINNPTGYPESLTLTNNLIVSNRAQYVNAGLSVTTGDIINCTFADNELTSTAVNEGGALVGSASVYNSIFVPAASAPDDVSLSYLSVFNSLGERARVRSGTTPMDDSAWNDAGNAEPSDWGSGVFQPVSPPPLVPGAGTWDTISFDPLLNETLFVDLEAEWIPGALTASLIKPSTSGTKVFPIRRNTSLAIAVAGDATDVFNACSAATTPCTSTYELRAYIPEPGGPAIDGSHDSVATTEDLTNLTRACVPPIDTFPSCADIGAYELR